MRSGHSWAAGLAGSLGPLLLAAARGSLPADARIATLPGSTVGVVIAAAGYPEAPRGGDEISGLDDAAATGALVFHAGTSRRPDGPFVTAGGRVLTVVGRGPDVAAAHGAAETAADCIHIDGAQRRHDIGADAIPAGAAR